MPLGTYDAIVLQVFPYGETSRILRLFTATHGVQSVIARGARRPRSQYGGLLEIFAEGMATIHAKENRDLQTLTGFELSRSRQSLGSDLMRFGGASLLAEIVLRSTQEESQPELFSMFRSALDRIEAEGAETAELTVLSEAWRLVSCLGFAPELHSCVDCGRSVALDEDVKFDLHAGGIRCDLCAAGSPGRLLPARARVALLLMAEAAPVTADRTDGHWWLLRRYLDHHVLEGSDLRSMAIIDVARGAAP
jgi:DNA repair protein RecO (recombination protein O)